MSRALRLLVHQEVMPRAMSTKNGLGPWKVIDIWAHPGIRLLAAYREFRAKGVSVVCRSLLQHVLQAR